jgi:hypothetical protein
VPQQPERAGPRACPEVEDAAHRRVGQAADVGADGMQLLGEHLGIKVEQVREPIVGIAVDTVAGTVVGTVVALLVQGAVASMGVSHVNDLRRVLRR